MPSFKVRSPITHGVRKDNGETELKDYAPGDSIDLTVEEAASMPHALEKAPVSKVKLPKEVQEAVDSIRNRPDHADSGVQLDWKVDEFARSNASGVTQASKLTGAADEAVGHGFERAHGPEAGEGEKKEGGSVKASDIPPGASTKDGKVEEPKKK